MTSRTASPTARAFTIVELLVVVSIIGLLVGILLPAIGKARNQARLTGSVSNLRQLGTAAAAYAAEWNDRQVTLVDDNLARYGSTIYEAVSDFQSESGSPHPPIVVGAGPGGGLWAWWLSTPAYAPMAQPIAMGGSLSGFGHFRTTNVRPFTSYLNGRYFDPVFWAPKDRIALSVMDDCFSQPFEFVDCYVSSDPGPDGDNVGIMPTYCWSAAALFSPDVFRGDPGLPNLGFQDPLSMPAGLRVPSMGHARYSDLKTHIVEHAWLQNPQMECNPNFLPGNYDGCEPFFFNHGRESVPISVFYDGHVEGIGTMEADAASNRAKVQGGIGLWHEGTPMGTDGYFISDGWDSSTNTSFHVLTTDGIRGRDKIGG